MIFLSPNELAIQNLITLVAHEPIQGNDDGVEVKTFRDRVDSILALGATVIVIRAFEDETQALWYEADIASFAPTEQVESDLPEAVILAHVIHSIAPSLLRTVKRLRSLGTFDALKALKAWVVSLPDSVVEVELCGEVPFPVIGMLAANVISMKCQ